MRWRHARTGSEHRAVQVDRLLDDASGATSAQVERLRRARFVKKLTDLTIANSLGRTIIW